MVRLRFPTNFSSPRPVKTGSPDLREKNPTGFGPLYGLHPGHAQADADVHLTKLPNGSVLRRMWISWDQTPGQAIYVVDGTDKLDPFTFDEASARVALAPLRVPDPLHPLVFTQEEQLETPAVVEAPLTRRWLMYFSRVPGDLPKGVTSAAQLEQMQSSLFKNWNVTVPGQTCTFGSLPLAASGLFAAGGLRFLEIWGAETGTPLGGGGWRRSISPTIAVSAFVWGTPAVRRALLLERPDHYRMLGPDPTKWWQGNFFSDFTLGGTLIKVPEGGLAEPTVIWDRNKFVMYFSSHTFVGLMSTPPPPASFGLRSGGTHHPGLYKFIGRAVSNDGTTWTLDPDEPVLAPGDMVLSGFSPVISASQWDSREVTMPSVVVDPRGGYHMFYSGNGPGEPRPGFGTARGGIGHAFSEDGIVWTRNPDNPVILPEQDICDPYSQLLGPSAVLDLDQGRWIVYFDGRQFESNPQANCPKAAPTSPTGFFSRRRLGYATARA